MLEIAMYIKFLIGCHRAYFGCRRTKTSLQYFVVKSFNCAQLSVVVGAKTSAVKMHDVMTELMDKCVVKGWPE